MSDAIPEPPWLSVILPSCDGPATQLRTLEAWAAQTIARRIEVVIVSKDVAAGADALASLAGSFAALRVIQSPPTYLLGEQLAEGVRVARAAWVAFGEDHASPAPDCAERIVEAFRRPENFAGVGVAMHNANPDTALSWGNLFMGYLNWVAPVPAGEADYIPGSNATFRRELLLPFGEALGVMLERGGTIQQELRSRGHRFLIEPQARVYHRNFSMLGSTLVARFHIGRFHGATRVRRGRWGWPKRLLRAAWAPGEQALRLAKTVKRLVGRRYPLRPKHVAGMTVGLCGDGAGLVAGYLAGMGEAERHVYENEFHRERHMRRSEHDSPRPPAAAATSAAPPGPHPRGAGS